MRHRFYNAIESIIQHYLDYHISRASAALSYFLMLTVFPMLICLYAMLGGLFPSPEEISELLGAVMPRETVDTLMEFVNYISANVSLHMLTVAIVAMATSSAAGFRIIDKVMFELRGARRRERTLAFVFSFVFSLVFLAALYVAALLIATGGRFISFADKYIDFIDISHNWEWFRFVILYFLLFVLILGVYRITAPKDRKILLVPGAVSASVALLVVSIVFSWFIGMSARYPLLYGSLASVMIMLFWLYICGNVLFLGNIVNISLEKMR